MKKQAKNKILASIISLLLALSLVVSIPSVNVQAAATSTQTSVTSTEQTIAKVQDGLILHAWNWSYDTIKSHLQEIKDAGYTTIQTSPVQQPKDYNASYTGVGDNWWKFYQPVSFSIAQSSWLGTAKELTELCAAAKDKDMKIICDIVVNHLGNDGSATGLASEIAKYEPEVYKNYGAYIHPYQGYDENTIQGIVRANIGMPDLNTGSEFIQGKVSSLLKQCVDCGVDGFRFDAAKHIETQDDKEYASSFWNNVLGTARSYAKETKNKELYVYGEILDSPGKVRSFSSYTSLMNITDNKSGNCARKAVVYGDAAGAAACGYNSGQKADKLVLWAESHDTYTDTNNTDLEFTSRTTSQEDVNKTWAIVASRADATSLYFVRPGQAVMGQVGSKSFESKEVREVNYFHNRFVGDFEYLSSNDGVVMNERYEQKGDTDGGAVLVNTKGTSKNVNNMPVNRLGDGTYTDQITGNEFKVENGKISGQIGNTGIAVVYQKELKPVNTVDPAGMTFTTPTLDVKLGLTNATSGTYKIGEDGKEVTYTKDTTITLGEGMEDGHSVTVYMTATDGKKITERSETYIRSDIKTVPVYFTNTKNWSNVYAYYWGGENPSNAWPGNQMTKVGQDTSKKDVYTIEVPTDVKGIIFTNGNGEKTADITTELSKNLGFTIKDGSSNPYTVTTYNYPDNMSEDPIDPVDPTTMITVYFTNNYSWSTVNAYYWGSKESTVAWPGTAMTYAGQNEFGQDVYSITIPSDVTGLIFNNGAGAQTANITTDIVDNGGFYISGGNANAYTVGTYTH